MAACRGEPSSPVGAPGPAELAPDATAPREAWTKAFDLDGDGRNDTIHVDFSGGAHCCYRISVTLSSTRATIDLPFLLDGGYVGGLDLSRPDHFDVHRIGSALPEMVMEIETYNGEHGPVPEEWKQRYRISTHHIIIRFPNGQLQVRDAPGGDGGRQ